jgi:hypothetical protein
VDELHEELDRWLTVLDQQVRSARINQHIFWEIQRIIRSNPKIDKPNDFYGWMAEMYAAAASVAVRKMVDIDKHRQSVSFIRFLQELKDNPEVISRTRYKRQFVDSYDELVPCCYSARDADEGFDQMVGAGREALDPLQIERQIKTLKTKTSAVRNFVNKRIAHHDRSEFKDFPAFTELDDAVAYLEELLKYYFPLFRGLSLDSALPTWLYDWKEIFHFPWIERT